MTSFTALARPQPSSSPTSPWRARTNRLSGSATTAMKRAGCSPTNPSATFSEAGKPVPGLAPPLKALNQFKPLREYELMSALLDTGREPRPDRFAARRPDAPAVAETGRPEYCVAAQANPA